jgi:hypothetical protein
MSNPLIVPQPGHKTVPGHLIVPKIEADLGRNWPQPDPRSISFEVTIGSEIDGVEGAYRREHIHYAYMNQHALDNLKDYSRSQPSGVYPGKMWKGLFNTLDGEKWYLCWYGEVPGRQDVCSVWAVPVLNLNLLELLNPQPAVPMPF